MTRKRGRPSLGPKTVERTYKMSEQDFLMLKRWAKINGFKISEVVRASVSFLMKKGELKTLMKDPELKKLAISILNQSLKNKLGDEKKND